MASNQVSFTTEGDYDEVSFSSSSDEELSTKPEPAELVSILWHLENLARGEDLEPMDPIRQPDAPIQQSGGSTSGAEAARPPPSKRPRGRPKKSPVAPALPPPKRAVTPPPPLTDDQRRAWSIRSEDRKIKIQSLLAKDRRSVAEHEETIALLEVDELDRHNCFGNWLWEEFEESAEYINEDITFQGGEGGGMSPAAQRANSELDCFQLFLTNAVVDNIVTQTNLYAQHQERAKEGGSSQNWTPVTREEIKAFIGLAIAMGILQKPALHEYWSTSTVLETPWFPTVMTGMRFMSIQRYLHLNNNAQAARTAEGNLCDKLHKVRPLLDSLSVSFPQHYHPRRELNIDLQMVRTKARCSFAQTVKDKSTKQEVKVWTLCDAKVHYCLGFQIYTGGSGEQGLSFRVVNELMCPYLGVGHRLYVDNFYTSPELLAHLLSHNTLAVGTVRQDRTHMPMRLRTSCQDVEVGQALFLHSHKMTACRWKDKQDVFCLSTVHGNTMKRITRRKRGSHGEEERVQKPAVICDYNTFMGGVDVYGQLLSSYQIARSYQRWWVKIFWRLIDMMVLNAYALWKLKLEEIPRDSHKNFRLALSEQLTAALMERDVPGPSRKRLANRLSHVGDPGYFKTRKRCTVCKSENKVQMGCVECGEDVRLHISSFNGKPSCFALYHSKAIL